MQTNRILAPKLRSKIILDKRFKFQSEVGEEGQLALEGIIDAERIEFIGDTDIFIKTIKILKVEKIEKDVKREI